MKDRNKRSRNSASPLSFIGPRIACVALCALLGLIFACSQLLLLQPVCSPEACERAHFEREQAMERQIGELEHRLLEEQRLRAQAGQGGAAPTAASADPGGGFQGALVRSLQNEVTELRGRNAELQSRLQSLEQAGHGSAALVAAQPPPLTAAPAPPPAPPAPVGFLQARPSAGGPRLTEDALRAAAARDAIGVVMISCKRPKYLTKAMESLLHADRDATRFPIVISQDADDQAMTQVVQSQYVEPGLAFHMHHAHQADAPAVAKRFGGSKAALGYVRIAQHYGFALRKMFDEFGFQQIIFVEEDMELAADFFSYFNAMLPMLRTDPDLFCVSAWNDNGYQTLVQDNAEAFRTDFFPGLGWMLTKSMWDEISGRWAVAYWDEFMRRPDVRKGRHCIRPEVSRTFTFGQEGVSSGQFFGSHLKHIKLSDTPVDWSALDLRRLASAPAFDEHLAGCLRKAIRVTLQEVDSRGGPDQAVRIEYDDKNEYKAVAKKFNLMQDEKEGIRRMSYRGVIPFAWQGKRVFLYTRTWPGDLN